MNSIHFNLPDTDEFRGEVMGCIEKLSEILPTCEIRSKGDNSVSFRVLRSILHALIDRYRDLPVRVLPRFHDMGKLIPGILLRKTHDLKTLYEMHNFAQDIGSSHLEYYVGVQLEMMVITFEKNINDTYSKTEPDANLSELLSISAEMGLTDRVNDWLISSNEYFVCETAFEEIVTRSIRILSVAYDNKFGSRNLCQHYAKQSISYWPSIDEMRCPRLLALREVIGEDVVERIRKEGTSTSAIFLVPMSACHGISITLYSKIDEDAGVAVSPARLCLLSPMFRGMVRCNFGDLDELKDCKVRVENASFSTLQVFDTVIFTGRCYKIIDNVHDYHNFLMSLPMLNLWFGEAQTICLVKCAKLDRSTGFEESDVLRTMIEAFHHLCANLPDPVMSAVRQTIVSFFISSTGKDVLDAVLEAVTGISKTISQHPLLDDSE